MFSSGVVLDGAGRTGWWLVTAADGRERVVAGPFGDRVEAEWAAEQDASGGDDGVRAAHGIGRVDGSLSRRPSPQDWAWLAHLGEQLDRLPEGWDAGTDDEDPLATLVVEVVAALAEAGLPLHDPTGTGNELGGACLSPEPGLGGLVATWRLHDRMSVDQLYGAPAESGVQQVMARALADVLALRGFAVTPFGAGAYVVCRTADLT